MNNLNKRISTSIVLLCLIYFSIVNSFFLLLFLIVIFFLTIKEINLIYKQIFNKNFFFVFIANFLSVTYLSIFLIIIWIYLGFSEIDKTVTLIFILSICVLTDIGGFVFGKLIGGKKLTKISPNKTYAGMFGSFIFSLIFGYLFYYFQRDILVFKINILLIIIIVSSLSQFGDLIISLFKRKAKIKDTGSILPGHGGILDRIDGILIAIPFGIILISL